MAKQVTKSGSIPRMCSPSSYDHIIIFPIDRRALISPIGTPAPPARQAIITSGRTPSQSNRRRQRFAALPQRDGYRLNAAGRHNDRTPRCIDSRPPDHEQTGGFYPLVRAALCRTGMKVLVTDYPCKRSSEARAPQQRILYISRPHYESAPTATLRWR